MHHEHVSVTWMRSSRRDVFRLSFSIGMVGTLLAAASAGAPRFDMVSKNYTARQSIVSSLSRIPGSCQFRLSLSNTTNQLLAVNRYFKAYEVRVFGSNNVQLSSNDEMVVSGDFMRHWPEIEWVILRPRDEIAFRLYPFNRYSGLRLVSLPVSGRADCSTYRTYLKYPDSIPSFVRKSHAVVVTSFPAAAVKW